MEIYINDLAYHSTVMRKSSSLDISNGILKKEFFLYEGLDTIVFQDKIDWNYRHNINPKTILLYLNSLLIIGHLLISWKETKNIKYLLGARDLALDWIDFDNKHKKSKRWSDHATADRTINFVNLAFALKNENIEIPEELVHKIYYSLDFLFNDENYYESNHGFMVDRALAYCALALVDAPKRDIWILKAWSRINYGILRDFSTLGVHLENSTEYHGFVKKMLLGIKNLFEKNNMPLYQEANRRLECAEKYYSYILQPNGKLPAIGDSSVHFFPSIEKNYKNFVDYEAGICVLQYKNDLEPAMSAWIAFIAGCRTATHKHFDDLSINYFFNGEEILVDSGKYNYDKDNQDRNFIISSRAHSTLFLKNQSYLIKPDENNSYIKCSDYNNTYSFVKGVNYSYIDSNFERRVILFKTGQILLIDQIVSDVKQDIVQNFCFAPNLEVFYSDQKHIINIVGTKGKYQLIQFLNFDDVKILSKDGIHSPKFNKKISTDRVEFSNHSKDSIFVTLIKKENDYFDINIIDNIIYVKSPDLECSIDI